MDSVDWEICGNGLASFVVDRASLDLANHNSDNHKEISSFRRMVAFARNKAFVRAVGANRISAVLQRTVIDPHTKQLPQALKLRLNRIWFAPPELAVGEPRKWWNLIATAGLSERASRETGGRLFQEIQEILIFAPRYLAEPRVGQPHVVSEHEESNRCLGQP